MTKHLTLALALAYLLGTATAGHTAQADATTRLERAAERIASALEESNRLARNARPCR